MSEVHSKEATKDSQKNIQISSRDNYKFSSLEGLYRGIEKVAEVIRPTYGPTGLNAIIEHELYPYHVVVNDCKTIVDAINLSDPYEKIGADILREVSDKSDKESGDGRKTTALLTTALLAHGKKALKEGISPIALKRELDEALKEAIAYIDSKKKEITVDEVAKVATIAAENEEVGKLIQEIYQRIGKEGIIEVEPSGTFDTSYEIKEGVELRNAGFISPHMANDGDRAIYSNPKILITKQRISTLADIDPLFQKLSNDKHINEIVIFCDDIDASVVSALAYTHIKGIFKTLIIKAPRLWKDWLFEDFAKMTGATVVDSLTGITWKTVNTSHLGTCDKLITSKENTKVIGIKDVSEYVKSLTAQNTPESLLRASWLSTKAAILKIGANSESELSYLMKKANDGRSAAFLALKDGVIQGGGIDLAYAVESLPTHTGGEVLAKSLMEPSMQIMENMRGVTEKKDDDIKDPALVVKNALRNAVSVAGIILTGGVVITLPKKDNEPNQQRNAYPI